MALAYAFALLTFDSDPRPGPQSSCTEILSSPAEHLDNKLCNSVVTDELTFAGNLEKQLTFWLFGDVKIMEPFSKEALHLHLHPLERSF